MTFVVQAGPSRVWRTDDGALGTNPLVEMSSWKLPTRLSFLAPMLALSCGMIIPLEPLPDPVPGQPGGSAGSDGDSGGGTSAMGGTSGDAGASGEGGTEAGRGGRTGGNGGDAGAAAGSGASGGSAARGGSGGQGGASGAGGAGAVAGTGGSGGGAGAADACVLENLPSVGIDPGARGLDKTDGYGPLGITVRAGPVLVARDSAFPFRYRAFALNARNEFVYADVPPFVPPPSTPPPPPEWVRIGSGNDYLFSPPAVAVTAAFDRMWVFGVTADRVLHYSVNAYPFDGSWTAPKPPSYPPVLSLETWSSAQITLSDEALSASATAFGNVLIAARCYDHIACVGIQPIEAMDSLTDLSFIRFPIESDYQPAAIEAAIGEAPPQVYVAITDKTGVIHVGVGGAGTNALWSENDFVWTELSGMCFESAPTLIAGGTGVDLFARGTDGAIYRQPLHGDEGLTKISPVVDTHPLVIGEGNSGLLVFAVTSGGNSAMLRRYSTTGWTDWITFAEGTPLLGSADRAFPGAALRIGAGVRLVVRDPTSGLMEYSFVEGEVN